ncbi:hypothetical protein CDL12_11596 [Handroanthus impetiginosus]|uniref:VQ domain-containing protein n=1 Tax=Handroanthus impetiginosus TaxID=429701 RepID=A0A2G9HE24_9LAMI|nr:hypothetical protein CDL12_11596 [Handroanthus impetiginosus]
MAKPAIQSPRGGGGGGDHGSKAGTTFVQADSACFRDLVQRLTGPSGNEAKSPAPKPTQKLHERRKYNKPKIEIAKPLEFQFQAASQLKVPSSPPTLGAMSPGGGYRPPGSWSYPVSPSSMILLSPPSSLQASPITTPVTVGSSNKRVSPSAIELNPGEEEKAIKEKRFYLHPSPRSKPRLAAEPELLTLFPLTSPTTTAATNRT